MTNRFAMTGAAGYVAPRHMKAIYETGNSLVAVLDPHGDLIENIMGHIPEDRFEDVVLFDPSDINYPVGINILSAHSEIEKNVLASDFVASFQRLSTSWGDQMTSVLGNAIHAFLESDAGGTLIDLRRFLLEKPFRQKFLERRINCIHVIFEVNIFLDIRESSLHQFAGVFVG